MLVRNRTIGSRGSAGAADVAVDPDQGGGPEAGTTENVDGVREIEPTGNPGVDVFVFRRVASMAFAPGMQVFPGGRVDERDADERIPWQGPSPEDFAGPLSAAPGLARALVVAAVRETFEECGVLLAGSPGGDVVTIGEREWVDVWRERHGRVLRGDTGLAEVLAEAGLVLRADLIRPWAHWITPPADGPRRYAARFFVAAMPAGQVARDLGGEGEQARWLPAVDGVQQYLDGQVRMLPPTVVCMEELAAAPCVAALLATPRRIRPVMPWRVGLPDGTAAVEVDLDGLGGGEPRA